MELQANIRYNHMPKTVNSLLHCVILTLINLFATISITAQTTWTGSTNSDWSIAANWSAGVPDTGDVVVIPDVANSPIIGAGMTARTKRLTVDSNEVLTLNSNAKLEVRTAADTSIINYGTIINYGFISVDSTHHDIVHTDLLNFGSIINDGLIELLAHDPYIIGFDYSRVLQNYGSITNNKKIVLNLDNLGVSNNIGIQNFGTINNNDTIKISTNTNLRGNDGSSALQNHNQLTNASSGVILIFGSFTKLIENVDGSIDNYGYIKSVGPCSYSVQNLGDINNNQSAFMEMDSSNISIYNGDLLHPLDSATFINNGSIICNGVLNKQKFINGLNGSIELIHIGNHFDAKFYNEGTISMLTNNGNSFSFALSNNGYFHNKTAGSIVMDGGVISEGPNYGLSQDTFLNEGIMSILNHPLSSGRIHVGAGGIFINSTGNINCYDGNIILDCAGAAFHNYDTINLGIDTLYENYGVIIGNPLIACIPSSFYNYSTGILNINNSKEAGVFIFSGSLNNSGKINIGTQSNIGKSGIRITGNFTNNQGGLVNINRSSIQGILIEGGTINNSGRINIGNLSTIGQYGLHLATGTVNNNIGGHIKIDRSLNSGIYNSFGTFNNRDTITIGSISSVGSYGIYNTRFFNSYSGSINIDRTASYAIINSKTFYNSSAINLGANQSIGNTGIRNIDNFTNDTTGFIYINRSTQEALFNSVNFTNFGLINIGNNFGIGLNGITNQGNFINKSVGQIKINRTTQFGLWSFNQTFTNEGVIDIGSVSSVGNTGLVNQATFNNNAGGLINIDRASSWGLWNSSGTFNNMSIITIGGSMSPSAKQLRNTALFNNTMGSTVILK